MIDYYLANGKRKRESVGHVNVIDRTTAEKALKIRRAEVVQGKFNIPGKTKSVFFFELVEDYLKYAKDNHKAPERSEVACKEFRKSFRNEDVNDINPWNIEQYKSKRKNIGLKPSTINRELSILKRIFSLGVIWNKVKKNPVVGVNFFTIPPKRPIVVEEKEFLKLYNAAPEHLKPILYVAYDTGMRKGEILKLKWDDLDLVNKFIVVRDSKNSESRKIPISNKLINMLLTLKENNKGEYLFCYNDNKPIKDIKRSFNTALRNSGIQKCTFHDLRHSFASRATMAGIDPFTVQELMGHKSVEMTKRYSHPTPKHKKEAINLIAIDTTLDTSVDSENINSNKNIA